MRKAISSAALLAQAAEIASGGLVLHDLGVAATNSSLVQDMPAAGTNLASILPFNSSKCPILACKLHFACARALMAHVCCFSTWVSSCGVLPLLYVFCVAIDLQQGQIIPASYLAS